MEIQPRPLAELEAIIERGLSTFVEVGQALLEIRDSRIYRESHLTFQAYCEQRWGFSRFRAYRLMEAATITAVLPIGHTPANEAQARELTRLPEPEVVREVWAEVTEEHGERVTAADVRQAVDRRLGVERPVPAPAPTPEPEPEPETEADPEPQAPKSVYIPADPDQVTVGDLVAEGFVLGPRGMEPIKKAWFAALKPGWYQRLEPDAVVGWVDPVSLANGIDSIERSVAYLTRLLEAARRAEGRTRLEVVQ